MTLKCDRVTLDSVKSSGAAANLFQGESRKYNKIEPMMKWSLS